MSAALELAPVTLRPMGKADLERVMDIELRAYDFAWSRGNFADSIGAGYVAQVVEVGADGIQGYFVAMPGFEEMHLLNITVDPALHGRGHGLLLLDGVLLAAVRHGADLLWLEVRPSNQRALRLYERYGFHAIARRRDYYPALDAAGRPAREDAIVMSARVDALCRRRGFD